MVYRPYLELVTDIPLNGRDCLFWVNWGGHEADRVLHVYTTIAYQGKDLLVHLVCYIVQPLSKHMFYMLIDVYMKKGWPDQEIYDTCNALLASITKKYGRPTSKSDLLYFVRKARE